MGSVFAGILLALAPLTATAAPDHWTELRSAHFTVITDAGEGEARSIATGFERMRMVLGNFIPPASEQAEAPIVVLALKNKKEFEALEPSEYLAKGEVTYIGNFLHGSDKNYAVIRAEVRLAHRYSTVYHEYTEYMMRNIAPLLPPWLNEGLPRFYQGTEIGDKEVQIGLPNEGYLRYLNRNSMLPLATLLTANAKAPYLHHSDMVGPFDAESWLLIHYLIFDDLEKGTRRLDNYMQLALQHDTSLNAARQSLGDLNQLQQALYDYLDQKAFKIYTLPQSFTIDEGSFQTRDLPAAQADVIRADILLRNGHPPEASALLDAVLAEDPKNEPAHEVMGMVKMIEKDTAGANKLFGEAVALDPTSYIAQYRYAITALNSPGNDHDEAIESGLRTAIKFNPNFAPAYDALARFYASRHRNLDQAHALNVQAVQLEPDTLEYRLDAADVLAQNLEFASALNVLDIASHIAHTPEQSALVQDRIDKVKKLQAGHDAPH